MLDRTDAPSALQKQWNRQTPKLIVCRDCAHEFMRRNNSQITCPACRKVRSKEISRLWYEKKQIARGARRFGPAICEKCGGDFNRTHSKQIRCLSCREEHLKTYTREWWRRKNGTTIAVGETIACQGCGTDVVKKGGKQKFCPSCRAESQKTSDRVGWRRRQDREVAIIGATIPCQGGCGVEVVRNGAGQKFCDACASRAKLAGARIWRRRARRDDAMRRLNWNLSSAICRSLKRSGKGRRNWESLVGYTFPDLTRHLTRMFAKGMTFENHGKWHIDHIRPLASFKFETTDDPEFKAAWALTNLQPLWAEDNFSKRDKRTHLL